MGNGYHPTWSLQQKQRNVSRCLSSICLGSSCCQSPGARAPKHHKVPSFFYSLLFLRYSKCSLMINKTKSFNFRKLYKTISFYFFLFFSSHPTASVPFSLAFYCFFLCPLASQNYSSASPPSLFFPSPFISFFPFLLLALCMAWCISVQCKD